MRSTSKDLHPFSNRLKQARENCSYTQKQLADISGVRQRTIERLEIFEKNDDPSPLAKNLLLLAQALDVTPEYLLLGEENMNIYMSQIKKELKCLTKDEIIEYHKKKMTDKVLAHLKLTESDIDEIYVYWKENTLKCRLQRPYVQDTIIRYCHNRPKKKQ